MTPWRRRIRHARRFVSAAFATVVISLAVLVGISQLALPWLTRNPDRVETWLSEKLGRSVRIGHIDSDWVGAGPRLTLDDVQIAPTDSAAAFQIPHAQLGFDLFAAFRRNRAWNELGISDLGVSLERAADGRWQLRGLVSSGDGAPSMGSLGALVLSRVALSVNDPSRDLHLQLRVPELRIMNLGGSSVRVLGHVKRDSSDVGSLDLVVEMDLATRSGDLYVGGSSLDLARLSGSQPVAGISLLDGHGTAQVWASLDHARIGELRARLDIANVTFASATSVHLDGDLEVTPRTHFDRLALLARVRTSAHDWRIDITNFTVESPIRGSPEGGGVSIACDQRVPARCRGGAKQIAIGPLANVAMLSDSVPAGLRAWLYAAAPRGLLASGDFDGSSADDFSVSGELLALRAASVGVVPGIELARAKLLGDAGALLLEVPQQPMRVDYPHVFRKPFVFSRFGGDVVAWRKGAGWRIATDRMDFDSESYGGELRGGIDLQGDGTRPALDLAAVVSHAEVPAAKLFWPINVMPPPVVEWLDRALVSGKVLDGRVVVRGDLDDWPFNNHAGRFEASCEVDDMTLDYHPHWPRAEHVHVTANFVGVGLDAASSDAIVSGVHVTSAHVQVADLGMPVLDLKAQASGSAERLMRFLRATPIGAQHAESLDALAIDGNGQVAVTVHLPISDEVTDKLTVDGNVSLSGVNLDIAAQDFHLTGISGAARFNQNGFATDTLNSSWNQRPAELNMAVGGYVSDPAHSLEARLDTTAKVDALFENVSELQPLLDEMPGEARWQLGLDIDDADAVASPRQHLWVASDLTGIAIHLPAPLAKTRDAALPFRLDLELPFAGHAFSANLGRRVAVRGRLPDQGTPLAARVEFGANTTTAPTDSGVYVGGRAAVLDANEWLALIKGGDMDDDSLLKAIDLRVDDLRFGKYVIGDSRIGVQVHTTTTDVNIDGDALAGRIVIPAANTADRTIRAEFKRLYVPDVGDEMDAADADQPTTVAPATLPPLRLSVEDFRLDSAQFGRARFESTPTPEGMRIDTLEAKSAGLDVTATGTWTGSAAQNRSTFAIDIKSGDLGKMLGSLGFAGLIEGGVTHAQFDASWPGPPTAFAPPKLTGTLHVDVDEGRILDVDPGAGRIFGLLSLREIPRRLSLDFTDIFRSGFTFNAITGDFRFADGNAWTDNLKIKSPAAEIAITGRTGLRAKDYDQIMTVTPHAGATLPLVGAVAGGPIGAAAGLVVQGLLGKQIGRAAQTRYHVGGSWEKPQIESIGKEKSGPKP